MKPPARILLVCVALATASCAEPVERLEGSGLTIIEGATLIDGTGAAPFTGSLVAVRGDRIERIASEGTLAYPPDAKIIDGRGRFLAPGFIDTHAHMPDPPDQQEVLGAFLTFGITSVRSPAGDPETGVLLRARLERGGIAGPRLLTADRLIDGAGGIFSGWAAEPKSEEEAREEVRRQAAEKVDVVKLYRLLPPPLVKAAIEEAHAHGLRVVGHLGATTWGEAAEDGIDSLAHFGIYGTPWELAPPSSWPSIRRACDECSKEGDEEGFRTLRSEASSTGAEAVALARTLAAKGITVEPNLVLLRAVLWGDDRQVLASMEPERAPKSWGEDWQLAVPHPYLAPCTEAWAREARATYPFFLELLDTFRTNGVILTVGTDMMNPWMTPGVSYHKEMELLAEAGFSTSEILRAATRNGAVALGIEGDTGTIEEGKSADLVLLRANPLDDIRNSRSIEMVMYRGRIAGTETESPAGGEAR